MSAPAQYAAPVNQLSDMMNAMLTRQHRTGIAVSHGFTAFIALGMVGSYVAGLLPPQEQDCPARCRVVGLTGQMVPDYSLVQTAGVRGAGPMECRCQ